MICTSNSFLVLFWSWQSGKQTNKQKHHTQLSKYRYNSTKSPDPTPKQGTDKRSNLIHTEIMQLQLHIAPNIK